MGPVGQTIIVPVGYYVIIPDCVPLLHHFKVEVRFSTTLVDESLMENDDFKNALVAAVLELNDLRQKNKDILKIEEDDLPPSFREGKR